MFEHELFLGALFFCIGIYAFIASRYMVKAFMWLELIFNADNVTFVASSNYLGIQQIKGEFFSGSVIVTGPIEVAIELAIVLAIYRNRKSIRIDEFDLLKRQQRQLNRNTFM
ncbi:hypothetical protein O6H91_05G042000 [Diphasiastrum complanatum]|uniref:Uncharacterized protein n=1 Tax=Diphasiastrum complanatum TaxID=34168 RepID=A0ACC2DMV6_DIPCM|nr:hypothetical protein O6H91_05G042000 [Diphasiastrum complanatum]